MRVLTRVEWLPPLIKEHADGHSDDDKYASENSRKDVGDSDNLCKNHKLYK